MAVRRGDAGAIQLDRSLQEIYSELYFPILVPLETYLVPRGDEEIRVELYCDWIDMRNAMHLVAKATEEN